MPDLALLSLVAFLGALVQVGVGIGFALIAGPVLLATQPITPAVQATLALCLVVSLFAAPQIGDGVARAPLARLTAGLALGLPLGVVAVARIDPTALRVAAGVAVVAGATQLALSARRGAATGRDGWITVAAGLAAGTMCGAIATPGPPAAWGIARLPLDGIRLRATIRAFFIVAYVAAIALHAATLGIAPATGAILLPLLPATAAGAAAGYAIGRRLGGPAVRTALLCVIALSGLSLLGRGLWDLAA